MKKLLIILFFIPHTYCMLFNRSSRALRKKCIAPRTGQTLQRSRRLFTTDAENEFHARFVSAIKISKECKETLTDPEITYEDLLLTKLKVNEIEHIRRETNSYFKKELKGLTDLIRYMELENDYQQLNTRMETLEQVIKGIFGSNQ